MVQAPNLGWDDIGGLDEVSNCRSKIRTPSGALASAQPKAFCSDSPPGTDKTLLAKETAHESNANFIWTVLFRRGVVTLANPM